MNFYFMQEQKKKIIKYYISNWRKSFKFCFFSDDFKIAKKNIIKKFKKIKLERWFL